MTNVSVEWGQLGLEDGTQIVYRVIGEEGPALLLCNGVTTTHFFWEETLPHWAPRRIVQWDYPGHGRSSRAITSGSARMESLAATSVRILDALSIERASTVGFSMGSQVALLAALEYPDRFDAVVSLLGPAGKLFETALWGVGGRTAGALLGVLPKPALHVFHRALHLGMANPATYRSGRLLGLYGPETQPGHVRALADHVRTLDASTLRAMLLSAGRLDLLPRLASLRAPLLILSGERDAFAPARTVARPMRDAAPRAQLVVLEAGTHGSLFGHARMIVEAIERFFGEHDV